MNFSSFSRYLYKRLSSLLLLWAFLLLTLIVITVTLTSNLESNGIALSKFATLATQLNRVAFTHQHPLQGHDSERDYQLAVRLKQSYSDLLGSLEQCCARALKSNSQRAITQFDTKFNDLLSLLVDTKLPPPQRNQRLQAQAQSINGIIEFFVKHIEKKNTRSITFLRIYRFGLLMVLMGSALIAYILIKHRLLNPLTKFAHQLISQKQRQKLQAVVEERNLLAQYLHDSVTQSLAYLNMQLHELSKHATIRSDEELEKRLQVIYKGMEHCHDDIRNLLANYRHSIVHNNTLEMIEVVVQRVQDSTSIPINLYVISEDLDLSDEHKIQTVFILQEALINSTKHSSATHIDVTLDDDRDFIMTIEDNGRGFAPHRSESEHQPSFDGKHLGMSIMQERARRIGAILNIKTQENKGTTIRLVIPQSRRHDDEG